MQLHASQMAILPNLPYRIEVSIDKYSNAFYTTDQGLADRAEQFGAKIALGLGNANKAQSVNTQVSDRLCLLRFSNATDFYIHSAIMHQLAI